MKGSRVLEDTEVRAILGKLGIRDRVFVLSCLTFGLRVSEALGLRFEDVSGSYLEVKSEKGSDNCTFPIPESYQREIRNLKAYYELAGVEVVEGTELFRSREGGSITRQRAGQILKRVREELGLEGRVSSHSFRKSFVTKIYQMTGKDLVETKMYSRHKSLTNLDYYIKTTGKTDLVNSLIWG